jgi:hypothetical protein
MKNKRHKSKKDKNDKNNQSKRPYQKEPQYTYSDEYEYSEHSSSIWEAYGTPTDTSDYSNSTEENKSFYEKLKSYWKTFEGKLAIIAAVIGILGFTYPIVKDAIDRSKEEIKIKKEDVHNKIKEIESKFKPKEIIDNNYTNKRDIKAVYNFQNSVLRLIDLREPHEIVEFGSEYTEIRSRLRVNLNDRETYDSRLATVFHNIQNLEQRDLKSFNIFGVQVYSLDTKPTHDILNDHYRQVAEKWISDDSSRNRKIINNLNTDFDNKSASISRLKSYIQPIIDFANKKSNYMDRCDIYDHFLYLNVLYKDSIIK